MSESSDNPTAVAAVPHELPLSADEKTIPWGATWVLLVSLSAVISSILVMGLHTSRGFFVAVLTAGVCILAALFDAWTMRIPNPLTYTAILLGIALNLLSSGLVRFGSLHADTVVRWLGAPGISQSLLGFGVCAILAAAAQGLGVGGGDAKLLTALGALLGLAGMGSVMVAALSVAFCYAVINLAAFGKLKTFTSYLAVQGLELAYFRRFQMPAQDPQEQGKPALQRSLPMAVPLAIGLVLAELIDLQARLASLGAGR
jgi:prepilin signal peptidase PulO-like enzyme (type II secretory pathway)